jgi:hypothetical protein
MVFGLLAAFAAQAAVVYKWVDADGVVHFSDQPVPGAQKINTDGSAGHSGTSFGVKGAAADDSAKKGQTGSPDDYTVLEITAPEHDQSFFGDAPVNAHLSLSPSLELNHVVTWFLNGTPIENSGSDPASITLSGLARGTYALSASVLDQASGKSRSAEAVNFYVKEPSLLSPQHK